MTFKSISMCCLLTIMAIQVGCATTGSNCLKGTDPYRLSKELKIDEAKLLNKVYFGRKEKGLKRGDHFQLFHDLDFSKGQWSAIITVATPRGKGKSNEPQNKLHREKHCSKFFLADVRSIIKKLGPIEFTYTEADRSTHDARLIFLLNGKPKLEMGFYSDDLGTQNRYFGYALPSNDRFQIFIESFVCKCDPA